MQLDLLLKRLESTYHTKITTTLTLSEMPNIESILFYSKTLNVYQANTLYLADLNLQAKDMISMCNFPYPILICGEIDPINFGLPKAAFFSKNIPLFELFNQLQLGLNEVLEMKLKKEELFHILQSGNGLQGLLDASSLYLHQPVTLCTTGYSIICRSPKNEISRQFDVHNGKHFLSNEAILNMKNANISRLLLEEKAPFLYHFDDEPTKDMVFCSILIHHTMIAYLCVEAKRDFFNSNHFQFIGDLSKMISVEMQKEEFFKERSGISKDYLLTELIEHTITSEDFARHRMSGLGIEPGREFQFIIFDFRRKNRKQLSHLYFMGQIEEMFPNSISTFYKERIVLLLCGEGKKFKALLSQSRLGPFLIHNQMLLALSYPFINLTQAHLFYEQSRFILKRNPNAKAGTLLPYEDCLLPHLFSMINDKQMLGILIHPDIIALKESDQRYHTNYCNTLSTYLEQNENGQQTAAVLNIHKSTFFYRLEKIKEMTSLDVLDSGLLLSYQISFYLLSYIETL